MWRSGNSSTQLVGMKTGAATMENSTEALKKLKIDLPCDPAIPLLGTHPEKMKPLIQKDICTLTFIAVLFTIAKTRKQPKSLFLYIYILHIHINIYKCIYFTCLYLYIKIYIHSTYIYVWYFIVCVHTHNGILLSVCSVTLAVSKSLCPHGLQPARLLCPGILQARTLEWVAMPSSRGSF